VADPDHLQTPRDPRRPLVELVVGQAAAAPTPRADDGRGVRLPGRHLRQKVGNIRFLTHQSTCSYFQTEKPQSHRGTEYFTEKIIIVIA
jgi:hypothetical protein